MSIRKQRSVRFKNILLMSSLRCFGLLVLIVLIVLWMLRGEAHDASNDYVSSLAASMNESLNLVDSTLQTVRRYLSVSEPLVEFCQSTSTRSLQNLEDIYDIVDLTVTYSDIVQDMGIVAGNEVRSFFNNYVLSYIDELMARDLYDFSSKALSAEQYFFFPDNRGAHDPMFIYLFPLLSTSTLTGAERVGTVVLACRMSALQSILELDMASPYCCTLADFSGQVVATHASGGMEEVSPDVQISLPSSALPLTIQISVRSLPPQSITPMALSAIGMLLGFVIFVIFYFSRMLHNSLVQPIDRMVRAIPEVSFTTQHVQLSRTGVEELDIIVDEVNRMIDQLEEASRNAIRIETQLIETQMRNNEAELYALQSQINPHFLFNTLQCIRSLAILHHAEDISTISSALSAILRYSIREMQQVSVREEMKIIGEYLKIIDIRYQNRFTYVTDVSDEVMNYACPRMIVQPLVENAIIHGVSAVESNGEVRIHGRVDGGLIYFEVADNGAGLDAEKLREIQSRLQLRLFDMLETHGQQGKSFGLLNIQRRVQLQYGEEYGLTISSADGWTRLDLRFPAVRFVREGF